MTHKGLIIRYTKDGTILRLKLGEFAALSQPRSDERSCVICHKKLSKWAVIFLLVSRSNFRMYDWVHINCLPELRKKNPGGVVEEYGRKVSRCRVKYLPISGSSTGCSFCGRYGGLLRMYEHQFALHPACIKKLINQLKEYYAKYEKYFIAESL